MRNLKKILALVLALVMSFSLMSISNAAFQDDDEIDEKNVEAIDVMTAIGVLNGNPVPGSTDVTFDPDDILTREQAAKVIAVMLLGVDNAEKLGTNQQIFTDVNAGRWSAGYIAYCVSKGIIAGDGNGKFRPTEELTGAAFGKMLLVALGYSAEIEGYVGSTWELNVATDMFTAGIDVGTVLTQPLSRADAAQMAFQAVKSPLVEYGSTITVGDVTIGNNNAQYVTSTVAREQRISDQRLSNNGPYLVEFGEKYIPGLVLEANATDVFGRPSNMWAYRTHDIGSYVDETLKVTEYTTYVSTRDVCRDVGYSALTNYDLYVYVDGIDVTKTTTTTAAYLLTNNAGRYLDESGAGVLTQIFVDDAAEEITIVFINTYLAKVSAAYNTTNKNLLVQVYDTPNGTSKRLSGFAGLDTYTPGTMLKVTWYGADKTVYSVEPAEVVSGVTVSGYTANTHNTTNKFYGLDTLTADDVDYETAATACYDSELLKNYNEELKQLNGSTYDLYLDDYGYVLGIQRVSVADNYIFVVGYQASTNFLAQAVDKALIITTDGEMKVVDIRDDKAQAWDQAENAKVGGWKDAPIKDSPAVNTWYTYTMDGDTYILQKEVYNQGRAHSMDRAASGTADVSGLYADFKTNNNYTNNTAKNNSVDAVYGNESSVYIAVKADTSVNKTAGSIVAVNGVTVGIRNANIEVADVDAMSSFTDDCRAGKIAEGKADTFFIYNNAGYVTYAVVVGGDITTSSNMVFFAYGANGRYYDSAIGKYYVTYPAIVNGELATVKVEDSCASAADPVQGSLFRATVDKNGWITELTGASRDNAFGDSKQMNTTANKSAKYTQTTGTNITMTLRGATLWVGTQTAVNDKYVVIDPACKVFVKTYNAKTYAEYPSVEAALAALSSDKGNVTRVTTVVSGSTGYATTLIITETDKKNAGAATAPSAPDSEVEIGKISRDETSGALELPFYENEYGYTAVKAALAAYLGVDEADVALSTRTKAYDSWQAVVDGIFYDITPVQYYIVSYNGSSVDYVRYDSTDPLTINASDKLKAAAGATDARVVVTDTNCAEVKSGNKVDYTPGDDAFTFTPKGFTNGGAADIDLVDAFKVTTNGVTIAAAKTADAKKVEKTSEALVEAGTAIKVTVASATTSGYYQFRADDEPIGEPVAVGGGTTAVLDSYTVTNVVKLSATQGAMFYVDGELAGYYEEGDKINMKLTDDKAKVLRSTSEFALNTAKADTEVENNDGNMKNGYYVVQANSTDNTTVYLYTMYKVTASGNKFKVYTTFEKNSVGDEVTSNNTYFRAGSTLYVKPEGEYKFQSTKGLTLVSAETTAGTKEAVYSFVLNGEITDTEFTMTSTSG